MSKSIVLIEKRETTKSKKLKNKFKELSRKNENKVLFLNNNVTLNNESKVIETNLKKTLDEFSEFLNYVFSYTVIINDPSKIEQIRSFFPNPIEDSEFVSAFENIKNNENLSSFLSNKSKPHLKQLDQNKTIKFDVNYFNFTFDEFKSIKNIKPQDLFYFQVKILEEYVSKFNKFISKDKNIVLIIEEPERYLSAHLVKEVANSLRHLNKYFDIYVSSYSSDFINFFYQKDTKIMIRKNQTNISDFKEINISNEWMSLFSPRINFFKSLISEKIIICEGINDSKLIEWLIYDQNITKQIEIINSNGKFRRSGSKRKRIILNSMVEIFNDYNKNIYESNDILIVYDQDEPNNDATQGKTHNELNQEIEGINKTSEKATILHFEENLEKDLKLSGQKNQIDFFRLDKKIQNQIILNPVVKEIISWMKK